MRSAAAVLSAVLVLATPALLHADPLPVGLYNVNATAASSGIHTSDPGTLAGTLLFDASSSIVSADLLYTDLNSGLSFNYTVAGPTEVTDGGHIFDAQIANAVDPSEIYYFAVFSAPSPSGQYLLTCGVDCDNSVTFNIDGVQHYSEVQGYMTPASSGVTPEPSTLALLGTGMLAVAGVVRRRPQ